MRDLSFVVGAFTTLMEAERASGALLEAGHAPDSMRALARVGGGRVLLSGRVAVHPAGEPARLLDQSERRGAAGVGGGLVVALLVAGALWLLPATGADPLAWSAGRLARPLAFAAAVALGAVLGAAAAARLRPSRGLPHELAFRYGVRLDEGDTVLGVSCRSAAEARSVQETMAIHGATLTHVTSGTLETADVPSPTPVPQREDPDGLAGP
jgi:hypothetical protein